jgi:hypothetical protein
MTPGAIVVWAAGLPKYEKANGGPSAQPTTGPLLQVPGRKAMSYTEEDWVDEMDTDRRGQDQ